MTEIYLLEYGDKSNRIPFRILRKNEHFYECASMRYPSFFGMSKPFRMCAHKLDLVCPLSARGFIKWAESKPDYVKRVMAAHDGNETAKETLREWDKIKREVLRGE